MPRGRLPSEGGPGPGEGHDQGKHGEGDPSGSSPRGVRKGLVRGHGGSEGHGPRFPGASPMTMAPVRDRGTSGELGVEEGGAPSVEPPVKASASVSGLAKALSPPPAEYVRKDERQKVCRDLKQ